MPALDAEDVRDANAAEASATDGSNLKLALRAEMYGRGNLGGAVRTSGQDGLAQKEVDDRPNASGHEDDDQHPEAGGHAAALDVAADIPNQEDVAGDSGTPGIAHDQAHGKQLMLVVRHNYMKEVLHRGKANHGQNDRPGRYHAELVLTLRGAATGLQRQSHD